MRFLAVLVSRGLEDMESFGCAPLHIYDILGHSKNLFTLILKKVVPEGRGEIVKNVEQWVKRQGTIKFFCESDYRNFFRLSDKIFKPVTGMTPRLLKLIEL